MAMKFGKREKMVVGSIIGLMVIVALDQLVFRDAADKYQKLEAQQKELAAKASSAAAVPADFDKDKFNAETSKDEVLMWKIVFGMDLIPSQPFVALTKPVKPTLQTPEAAAAALAAAAPGGTPGATTGGDTATDSKDLAAKMEIYNKKLQDWNKIKEWKDTAIEGILAHQIERLINMKTAYEGQQVWPGDAILTDDTTATINTQMTNPLLLSFLTGSNKSWQIPLDLTLTGADLQAAVIAVNN
ncbi:MAG TPA: hypothetical protein PKH31_17050, partial [Candidatus Sumerlaeota bacterium]|nr:hypothetical protein [Candidatus Sumerlaeota bacterium]